MNAHALLTSQGWQGTGHSLKKDGSGLTRPILVSQKQNTLGLGKKQHHTSDMWWMNAFDKSLKGLDTSEEGKVIQTITNSGLDMVAKGGSKFVGSSGLYSCFVRGESLSGTITPEETDPPNKKRRTTLDKDSNNSKMIASELPKETKEEKRARKAAKRAAKRLDNSNSRPRSLSIDEADLIDNHKNEAESKAERRERRRLKKSKCSEEQRDQESDQKRAGHEKSGTGELGKTKVSKKSKKAGEQASAEAESLPSIKKKSRDSDKKRKRKQ